MQKLCITKSAIRMRPPSELTAGKWFIEDFDERKVYAVPEIAVCMLLYCLKAKDYKQVLTEFTKYYYSPKEKIVKIFELLSGKKLIVESDYKLEKSNWKLLQQKYMLWNMFNWGNAVEYHFFTYDYSFLDYSPNGEGAKQANQRMLSYSNKEPDINRNKIYPDIFKKIFIPLPFKNDEIILDKNILENRELDKNKLAAILGFAFAKTAEAPTFGWEGSPLMRRTSPSGGSRHPTEGYIFILDVKDIDTGLYHIQSTPFCLTLLGGVEKISTLTQNFATIFKNPRNIPSAVVVLSSIFGRNMYRYREPRTFRTVHMDAGHIIGTLELVADYVGVKVSFQHEINYSFLESIIEINGFIEGVLGAVFIYDCDKH